MPNIERGEFRDFTATDYILNQRQKYVFRSVKVLLVFMLFMSSFAVMTGCDTHRYHKEALELIDSIHELLISEKLCSNKNDCTRKQYAFFEAATGVYIGVYGITDKSIIKKITGLCIEKHSKNPAILYELHVHPDTRELSGMLFRKTTLKLTLSKE